MILRREREGRKLAIQKILAKGSHRGGCPGIVRHFICWPRNSGKPGQGEHLKGVLRSRPRLHLWAEETQKKNLAHASFELEMCCDTLKSVQINITFSLACNVSQSLNITFH